MDLMVNVAGYHFHFISADRKTGGHVLDGQLENIVAQIDYTPEIKIILPTNQDFQRANLGDGKSSEINQIEK